MNDYTKMDGCELLNECGGDATKWANAYVQHARKVAAEGKDPLDAGWLISWFANAMMRALDERRWAAEKAVCGDRTETLNGLRLWVAERLEAEVARRPDGNVYKRCLRDTWNQVDRKLVEMLGSATWDTSGTPSGESAQLPPFSTERNSMKGHDAD